MASVSVDLLQKVAYDEYTTPPDGCAKPSQEEGARYKVTTGIRPFRVELLLRPGGRGWKRGGHVSLLPPPTSPLLFTLVKAHTSQSVDIGTSVFCLRAALNETAGKESNSKRGRAGWWMRGQGPDAMPQLFAFPRATMHPSLLLPTPRCESHLMVAPGYTRATWERLHADAWHRLAVLT